MPLPNKINSACLSLDKKSVYFFIGDHVAIYDIKEKRVIRTPKTIEQTFPTWPKEAMKSGNYRVTYRQKGSYLGNRMGSRSYHIIAILDGNKNNVTFYEVFEESIIRGPFLGDLKDGLNTRGGFAPNPNNPETTTDCFPYNMIGNGPNYSIDYNGTKFTLGLPVYSSSIYENTGPLSADFVSEICSTLVMPDKNGFVFSGNQVCSYGKTLHDIVTGGLSFRGMIQSISPKYPDQKHAYSTNIAHVFQGVPLEHHEYMGNTGGGTSLLDSPANAAQHVKEAKVHRNNIVSIPNIKETIKTNTAAAKQLVRHPHIIASMEHAKSKGYGVIWIGGHVQGAYYVSGSGTSGIAIDVKTLEVKLFVTISAGIGAAIGAGGGIMIGYHAGSLEEFHGFEWAVAAEFELEIGAACAFEYEGTKMVGFALGAEAGAEFGISAEAMYRYLDS